MKEIPLRPTADLLSEYVFGKVTDTAIGGAIANELHERDINVNDVVASVRELLAIWADRADGLDEPERNDDPDTKKEDHDV